ncbi:MAG: thiamine pyrophosphokinae [Thermoplasmata archaeon]|jgi:thiamine pyrophosphokinase|nr:thiamine pyrophosphokinae [Thermoplasmata archaeon]
MRAVLVFPRATAALVRAHVRPGDRVLAVDAGAEALREAGARPDRIVGDMDSVSAETLARFEAEGVPLERHPAQKDETDAALALAHAKGCDEVLFLGPGGGRPDHALANLHLLAAASAWARVRAADEDGDTYVVTPERELRLDLPEGALLSAIPFDARVEGITYDGLRYPLVEAMMVAGEPYGVSNLAGAPPQRIRVRKGRLIVIVPRE